MSKLAEKLRKVGQTEAAPIGFGLGGTRGKHPPLLLLAALPAPDVKAMRQAVDDGADAVLLGPGAKLEQVKKVLGLAGEAPVGVTLADGSAEAAAALHRAGGDFVVVSALASAPGVLHLEGPDKLLELDPGWSDATLRAVEGLPLDGALVRLPGPFTLETWMLCLRVVGLTRRTLLVALGEAADVTTDTLRSLRDAGVSAVIVGPGAVATARQTIDTLPGPKRPREHREALLPLLSRGVPAPEEEEEEERALHHTGRPAQEKGRR